MIPGPTEINPQKPIKDWLAGFLSWRYHHKYTFNFIALIAFLILLPFLATNPAAQVFIDVLIILVLIFAVHAISDHRTTLVIGVILALIAVLLDVVYYVTGLMKYYHFSVIVALVFFAFVTIVIFSGIIRENRITFDTIAGALSVYFLMGITWAFGIMAMETAAPGSFDTKLIGGNTVNHLSDYIGYSFSVLTTTGNYNVSAMTSTARMIMMFEMIVGTLYIAVLISWLVGRFLFKRTTTD
ncbi:MAG TPA: hypothetical protein VMC42_04025 [Methanoregulaceae archaeon]|nr:hypothetical protein [Methanoregulaceae archaeon]